MGFGVPPMRLFPVVVVPRSGFYQTKWERTSGVGGRSPICGGVGKLGNPYSGGVMLGLAVS